MKRQILNMSFLLKQFFITLLFILIGVNVLQNLSIHVKNQSVQMNVLDFYSLLFINTQNPYVDYIDFRSPITLLGIVTIMLIGAIYTSAHFISFNKQNLYMVLMRYGNLKSYIREMRRESLKKSFIFTVLLNTLFLMLIYTIDKSVFSTHSSYSTFSKISMFSIIINYFFILFLFVFTISRLMIYVNLIKGNITSLLVGLLIPIVIIMIDINQTKFNVILFDYDSFFLDSLIVVIIVNVLISLLGKMFIQKYELYF